MRRIPLASIIGGLSKKVGRMATLVNTIGGDLIGRSDFDYRGALIVISESGIFASWFGKSSRAAVCFLDAERSRDC